MGASWKDIAGAPEKAKYEALALADKARYEKDLEVYNDMLAEMDEDELAEYNAENGLREDPTMDEDDERSGGKIKKSKKAKR